MLKLHRNGAVGFIDWLDAFGFLIQLSWMLPAHNKVTTSRLTHTEANPTRYTFKVREKQSELNPEKVEFAPESCLRRGRHNNLL